MRFESGHSIRAPQGFVNSRALPRLTQLIGVLLLLFVNVPGSNAATLSVCPSGCPFATIQSAVNHAKSGDTLSIGAGTYFENVRIPGETLTLQGVGRRRVVIDGGLKGAAFTIGSGLSFSTAGTVTFSELTIMRGLTDNGGAIQVLNASPVTIEHSILLSNRATAAGGAVYTEGPTLTITDCNFVNNQAVGSGGALYMGNEEFTLTITASVFSHNWAGSVGGAVGTCCGHVSQLTVTNSSFVQNQAQIAGALNLVNQDGGELQFTDVIISGNAATAGGGGGLVFSGDATLTRSIVTHNVAAVGGGGILVGDLLKTASKLSLVDSEVNWNAATNGRGGGVLTDIEPTLNDSQIAHNTPDNCVIDYSGQPC